LLSLMRVLYTTVWYSVSHKDLSKKLGTVSQPCCVKSCITIIMYTQN